MTDPVSWLQIQQGWSVVSSDDVAVGTVEQIEGSEQDDIFDGLAVKTAGSEQLRYVPGEQVGAIYPGEVTLKIAAADTGALAPFEPAPPETKWAPGKPSFSSRVSTWLGRKRY